MNFKLLSKLTLQNYMHYSQSMPMDTFEDIENNIFEHNMNSLYEYSFDLFLLFKNNFMRIFIIFFTCKYTFTFII